MLLDALPVVFNPLSGSIAEGLVGVCLKKRQEIPFETVTDEMTIDEKV